MSRLRQLGVVGVGGAVLVAAAAGGAWAWVEWVTGGVLTAPHVVHAGEFPIPFPLSESELSALRAEKLAALASAEPVGEAEGAVSEPPADPLAGVDLDALARERAAARGKHLVESRYACIVCHGVDFGGGEMINDSMIGTIMGPNLTLGEGSVTKDYAAKDWDRKVRHGVDPDGMAGFMPSEDYQLMSDRELSDIVTYIRSSPPVDRAMPPVRYGPLGKVLLATGQITLAADRVAQKDTHSLEPPPEGATVEFGLHLSGICTGCHRPGLEGGAIPGGAPDWIPAANITPHEQGLKDWTFEDFSKVMRSGITKSGATVRMPMSMIVPYTARMNETELRALWVYLQSVPPRPDGA